ncbi:hypothetical protein BGZ96_010533 [Linnemannia gamsii]|uniref:Uncharacterized protein n=1 Tax=Linnemannia gamsii TaxID=64522 RepID=A0ABQ7JV27_9FUNG|nr:hypothetical protein BGZ96_010533 [Linnemannia gamsii]
MACGDKEMAQILRSLPSRRLTFFEPMNDTFGPLTYSCLKEIYFGQLTNLSFADSSSCTSAMVQEVKKTGSDIRCWSGLLQMQMFSFDGYEQRLAMEEAGWMVEYWPELRLISGNFKGVEGHDCVRLERLFVDRDISYYQTEDS